MFSRDPILDFLSELPSSCRELVGLFFGDDTRPLVAELVPQPATGFELTGHTSSWFSPSELQRFDARLMRSVPERSVPTARNDHACMRQHGVVGMAETCIGRKTGRFGISQLSGGQAAKPVDFAASRLVPVHPTIRQ
jgi:hypothetical protein